jgi:hypothetical protein
MYPPHTSQTFQVLDSLLFGKLKAARKYLSRDFDVRTELYHVMRDCHAYEIATASTIVRASEEKTGFGHV